MGRTGASFDQKSIGFDFLLDKFPEIEPFPEIELFTRNRFGNHGSHIDFFGKRDQDLLFRSNSAESVQVDKSLKIGKSTDASS